MRHKTKELGNTWPEMIFAVLGIAVLQTTVSVGRAQWLIRKSREDQTLSAAARKLTHCGWIRVFILSRNDVLEAFAYPSGEIFITEELFEILDFEEMLAVALHEAGHVVLQAQVSTSLCKNGVLLSLLGHDKPISMSVATSFFSGLVCSAWHERLADSYARRLGYGPLLASALGKLYANSEPMPPTILGLPAKISEKIDKLFRIHPEIKTRMEMPASDAH